MAVYPQTIEGFFDPVLGVIRFPPGKAAAWLDAEIDPASDLSEVSWFFYDLDEEEPRSVRAVLDQLGKGEIEIKLDGDRAFFDGCPGFEPFAADTVPLFAACVVAARFGGEGVVLFLGTKDDEQADCAVVLEGGKSDVRFLQATPKPPALSMTAAEIVEAVGGAFDDRVTVAKELANVGYPSAPAAGA
jgi:hypothetical protein